MESNNTNCFNLPTLPEDTIVEAIFNIQARSSLSEPRGVKEGLKQQFSQVEEIHRKSFSLRNQSDGSNELKIEGTLLGYKVQVDNEQISTFQESGFSFHKLKPYVSFDQQIPNVIKQWELHKKLIEPNEITHISLRMINEIHPKSPNISLEEIFSLSPQYPALDGIHPKGFTIQTHLVDNQNDNSTCDLTLTQRSGEHGTFFILDINCVTETNKNLTVEEIQQNFETLRIFKNRIYSGSFTNNYLQLLKKG